MHQGPVGIAQHLDFHMAGTADQLFKINFAIAKGGLGFAFGGQHLFCQVLAIFDHAHATAATAPTGLKHDRIPDLPGDFSHFVDVIGQGCGCRHHRHPGGLGHVARRNLVAQRSHYVGIRADKGDARVGTGIGKVWVFRQKTITGMNGINPGIAGNAQNILDIKIGANGFVALANPVGFIGFEPMQGKTVFIRKNRYRADAKLVGGTQNANRNFTAIGNQKLTDFLGCWT